MAQKDAPQMPGRDKGSVDEKHPTDGGDLEGRRRSLDAALAARSENSAKGRKDRGSGGGAGFAQALKLSSEFIAGILVGAGIGYLIDRFVGTSPWGLVIFLLLGFAAGVLNVLRSAGMVAEPKSAMGSGDKPDKTE
ncbi:AtpZ/AtpI family protein [Oricola cellulosilytica]|uniref:ATP synthase protein I n=1 Tax=Oricola cellulosilytica TaxID=1429082 RepID=A0A4R0PBV0_9HYPH|nr:ATP F0F1 synthase subunit I [Oricola cellulosilytica]